MQGGAIPEPRPLGSGSRQARRLFVLLAVLGLAPGSSLQADSGDFFEASVRPLLAERCFACHTDSKLGGLRLDSREAMLTGGARGPAIAPGDPAASLLLEAVGGQNPDLTMPPQGPLEKAEIAALETWIRDGAVWPEAPVQEQPSFRPDQKSFWAFQPVKNPEPPDVRRKDWARGAIDRFVLARLEAKRLEPAPPADKRTLLRRVTLDLTGLPPTPEQAAAFLADDSPQAFAKVVDRLLDSPAYGERWGRYWLDIARYADELPMGKAPYAWPYRDWVIDAFNRDLPFDLFVKAQIAGDLIEGDNLEAGLGLFVDPTNEFTDDDRVDLLTRGFLGLTVACAQCHDHKYDPIPTKDYYALLGVFKNTVNREVPLAPPNEVEAYQRQKEVVDGLEAELRTYQFTESMQTGEALAGRSADYLVGVWRSRRGEAPAADLDAETLERWSRYLDQSATRQHPYLRDFEQALASGSEEAIRREAEVFEKLVRDLLREKRAVDAFNQAVSFGIDTGRELGEVEGRTMERAKYMLWQDLLAEGKNNGGMVTSDATEDGILYYRREKVERFLTPARRAHLDRLREQVRREKAKLPPRYPYFLAIEDVEEPKNLHVHIRGNGQNLGEEAPRGFLTILGNDGPRLFFAGSGRRELAEAVADPKNPLTARVWVNRIWRGHFGRGIVGTESNFGQTGERPTHPELLDYLASRLVEQGWSTKALHREILLSATYALSADPSPKLREQDPANKLFGRFERRRLDAEALRDSLLFVSGELDPELGGPPVPLADASNRRRTVYGEVSRPRLDPMLVLFDFPNPNVTSEGRVKTTAPLQRLFLLNSPLILAQSQGVAERLEGDKVARLYAILFQRAPTPAERERAMRFVHQDGAGWAQLAQTLMASNEFLYVE